MDAPRTGPSFRVLAVVPVGDGQRATDPPAGRRLDLWLPAGPGAAARESLSRELDALGLLSQGRASPPAPRLFDRLEGEEPGGVVDACTTDLERWWVEVAAEAEGFRTLCLALADVCRRAGDWAAAARREPALARLVPRIRPRSVLRTVGGRWVLSGFGAEALPVLDGDEDGQGTEVLAAVSHFQPPEELFQATGGAPMAGLAWAIGSTFFSLLKLRAFLCAPSQGAPSQGASSSGRRPELPQGGTDSPHLGSHRAALVEEHLRRRPAAFVDQPLDPRQFLYPDRLPERDRRVVAEAVAGLLGPEQQVLEEQLARDCLQLLDSALAIDPARRYLDPLVMAGDFEGLARRVQALRSGLAASRLAAQEVPRPAEAPAAEVGLPEEPTAEAPLPPEGALAAEEEEVPGRGGPTEAAHGPEDTSDQPTAHRAAAVQGRASAPEDPPMPPRGVPSSAGAGAPPAPPAAPSTPTWVRGAILGLVLSQAATLALVGALWSRLPAAGPPARAGSPPAAPLAELWAPAAPSPERDLPTAPTPTTPEAPAPEAPAPEAPAPAPAAPEAPAPASTAPEAPAPAPAAPAPQPPAAPAPSTPPAQAAERGVTAAPARLEVEGASAMLEGPGGRRSPGEVEPGTWTVLVREGDQWVTACTATVGEGQQGLVRCGFGQCRQVR